MELQRMKELADLMNQSGLTAIEICEGSEKVRLERGGAPAPAVSGPVPSIPAPAPAPAGDEPERPIAGKPVKSPMVGVFYTAPGPDQPPFVSVGDRVKKGQVLCIVEAMKLMNEITAEQEGTVLQVCAESGALVEYGQTLLVLE